MYGVEIVPQAIEDARRNAEINGIHNAEFFVGKAEEVLPEQFEKKHVHADVIVVDPPRKGCDAVCLDTILKMRPEREELRSMFGMVLQDTWLYSGTIYDNIRYGRLDARKDEIINAAKMANVHHFIRTLPDGYNSHINEEANNISQGEKRP